MAFILDGLDTESFDRTYSDGELIRRIVRYFRPHRPAMVVIALVLTLNSLSDAIAPVIISRAIDMVAARPATRFLILMSSAVLGVGAAAWLFNFVRQMLTNRVVGDVVLRIRQDVFERAVHHDMSFFDEHPVGKIVSRVTSDTQDFSNTVTLVIDFASQVLIVLALTIYLLTVNWWLTVTLLVMAPLAAAVALSFRRLARRVTLDAKKATAVINGHMQESIGGIAVAKAYRQERRLYEDFRSNNRLAYRVGLRRGLVLNLIFPLVGIAAGVGTGAVAYLGGLGVTTAPPADGSWFAALAAAAGRSIGGMSPGQWYLFLQAVAFFWWPMLGIASFFSQFQDGLSAAERVFALIDAESSVRQTAPPTAREATDGDEMTIAGSIEFDHVQFAYSDKETVLEDFSLTIEAGQTVALVGHTGAGKSSIARLVTRFYEFQRG
ncbi:MAG: ABC transporter ATP-binding protein/permease, partial [Spirochaetales bacterium]|nr:ABC transporter ATP-binding protein/permease [Spirochaetales bacterium]